MIEIRGLKKVFTTASGSFAALDDINLTVNDGEIFGIIGLSGAGKSTLVRCINLLERPTEGQVLIDGTDITALSQKELLSLRRSIGMIFQHYNLLEQRTVLKNILFPLELVHTPKDEALRRANELLDLVGLQEKKYSYPTTLSGGQKQRVAIARALATKPRYLLCDEATSALDPNTTSSILDLLKEINRSMGVTVVVITHEMAVIDRICSRVAVLDASHVVEVGEVNRVFVDPQSAIAKELILPGKRAINSVSGGKRIRIVFNGESSYEPLVSNLVLDCGVPVNIMFADTKDIGGKAYGQILLELPPDEIKADRVVTWLQKHHPSFTEEE